MTYEWGFSTVGSMGARYGDDPTKYALDKNLGVFVREVLQNANDQGPVDESEPVRVVFDLQILSGDEFADFRDAFSWDELAEHLDAVPEGRSRGLTQYLDRLEEEGEILLLTVEDQNTTGLTGTEDDDDSNYTALVRDVLYSHKRDDTAGGSYGLGKAVLWAFSGLSTVIFNSTLSEGPEGHESPRLIARTQLPTHKSADGETIYQGQGWFGASNPQSDSARPLSVWGDNAEELAERLHTERPRVPGTSATVVGFRDPTVDEPIEVEQLGDEICEAAVKNFWPAIEFGSLEVKVKTPDRSLDASVDAYPDVKPFVEAVSGGRDPDEELTTPGDVAVVDIDMSIPDRYDDTSTEDGSVTLAVRLAESDSEGDLLNTVAMFRGAGMVVRYFDRSRVVLGNRDFHAVLLGGRARGWNTGSVSKADNDIDRFLRAAEPPEHDDWKSTENLTEGYQLGGPAAIDRLKDDITDELRKLVQQSSGGGKLGPELLGNRFDISGKGRDKTISPSTETIFEGDTSATFDRDTQRWKFDGVIGPTADGHDGWSAAISLTHVAEDGGTANDVSVSRVKSSEPGVSVGVKDGEGTIQADDSVDSVEFEGVSEVDRHTGEIRLDVEGQVRLLEER